MASDWFSYPLLQSRESVKLLLVRNEEVLSASAKEAGCSVGQLRLAMEKYHIMTEKERETMTAVEAKLFMMLRAESSNCCCDEVTQRCTPLALQLEHDQRACGLLRGGCSCGGSCECGGTCSGNCNCGNCSGESGRES